MGSQASLVASAAVAAVGTRATAMAIPATIRPPRWYFNMAVEKLLELNRGLEARYHPCLPQDARPRHSRRDRRASRSLQASGHPPSRGAGGFGADRGGARRGAPSGPARERLQADPRSG